ncbi:hypothetical protein ACU6RU_11600 [Microbacterium sp. F1-18]|uniref:hypothetical protein n=1 Tax=unclassified Microbacterium TaxID=2609290 RepID=UPI000E7348E8|nr:hypothetical protein [Microbacterium sp. AG238]
MPQHSRPNLTRHARLDRGGASRAPGFRSSSSPSSTSPPPRSFWLAAAAAHIALHVFLSRVVRFRGGWSDVEKLEMTMAPEVMSPRTKAALAGVGHLT